MSVYVQTSANVTAGNDAKATDFNKAVADIAAIIGGITVGGAWGTTGSLTVGKALIPSNVSTASGASQTPNSDNTNLYLITALATNATINAPTGSPVDGQILTIRIKDNGTSRTLTWNGIYRVIGCVLPTATTINKTVYISMRYNAEDSVWDVLGVGQQ